LACKSPENVHNNDTQRAAEKAREKNALCSGQRPLEEMRILLQHARTRLYLKGLGDWTANVYEALDFQHSQRAIEFAHQHALGGLQIAVRFLDSEDDEIAPLPPFMQSSPIQAARLS
jgi:hypothetical protein